MAEGLFKKYTEARAKDFVISSAGINALDGYPATPETLEVLEQEGVDMSGHRSRRLTYDMVRTADHIYVMEEVHRQSIVKLVPEAADKVWLLGDFAQGHREHAGHSDIPDPIRMSDSFYRNVMDVIRDCVKKIVEIS